MTETLYRALEEVQKKANEELEGKGYVTANDVVSFLNDELGLNAEETVFVIGELYGLKFEG